MDSRNELHDISPRPEWSFAEVVQHAWRVYTGGGIDSGGRRNVLYRIWASMVGATRAVAELDYFIELRGGITGAAEQLGCRESTLRRLKQQFNKVGTQALIPMPIRLTSGEQLAGKRDKYLVDRVLGAGGMGVVYKVVAQSTSKSFAAKVLSSERFVVDDLVRDRFERECHLALTFTSPNVVRSYECLRHRGTLVSIQELLSGKSLYDEIEDEFAISGRTKRLSWLDDVATGMAYLHSRNIIHRDLSPRNCLLRDDGAVAIGDFGVARRTDDHTMTTLYERMGSLIYISPQQRENPHLADFRDDVYALGQLAYHILTGQSPHGGTAEIEREGYSVELAALVRQSRSRTPQNRPRSAEDFLAALHSFSTLEKGAALAQASH